jgi:hypothetical protein
MLLATLRPLDDKEGISEKWRKKTCRGRATLADVDGTAYPLLCEEASLDEELKLRKMMEPDLVMGRKG